MTKLFLGLMVLTGLITAGCGGSDDEPSLQGTWQLAGSDGCFLTYVFNGTRFSVNTLCELKGGGFGVEIFDGTFSADAEEIVFAPIESSCPATTMAAEAHYLLQTNQLTIAFPDGAVILERAPEGGTVPGGLATTNGCWDFSQSPGLFTPGKIKTL